MFVLCICNYFLRFSKKEATGMTEEEHTYICIDLKSFYASVECVERHLDPLKARLLVADESRTDKTICLAVSPALKALGVPGRPRLFEAKEKIHLAENALHRKIDYIIAVPRMATYIRYSAKVYSIYLKFFSAEDIHVYSVDEVFIDITPYRSVYPCSPYGLVRMVIREILKETGITATGGIGTNMYLAKIAMDIVAKHKPADKDGVRIAELTEESYKDLLWDHTPITDFWQIAHGISGRLARYGIYTMGELAELSIANESLLYQIFGVNAELLIDHAWGIEPCTMKDIKSYHTGSHSLSNGQVLPRAYSPEEAGLTVREQAELLSLQMVKDKVCADSMTMGIGYEVCSADYTGPCRIDMYGRKVPAFSGGTIRFGTFTNYSEQIIPAAEALYRRIVKPNLKVRRIFLTVNNVRKESAVCFQLDFFHNYDSLEKKKRLEKAVLQINSRYGPNAVLRGISLCDGARTRERNTQIGGHKA